MSGAVNGEVSKEAHVRLDPGAILEQEFITLVDLLGCLARLTWEEDDDAQAQMQALARVCEHQARVCRYLAASVPGMSEYVEPEPLYSADSL